MPLGATDGNTLNSPGLVTLVTVYPTTVWPASLAPGPGLKAAGLSPFPPEGYAQAIGS